MYQSLEILTIVPPHSRFHTSPNRKSLRRGKLLFSLGEKGGSCRLGERGEDKFLQEGGGREVGRY